MKHLKILTMLFCAILAVTSCIGKSNPKNIGLSKTNVSFGPEASSIELTFKSGTWFGIFENVPDPACPEKHYNTREGDHILCGLSWLSVEVFTSEHRMTISVTENTTGSNRQGEINVSACDDTQTVTIFQSSKRKK